jgi:hypothetical protein
MPKSQSWGWWRCGVPVIVVLLAVLAVAFVRAPTARADTPTVLSELARFRDAGVLDPATYGARKATYDSAVRLGKKLPGFRGVQMRGVVGQLDGIAARGDLTPERIAPLWLTLERNGTWWQDGTALASGARITFPGSQLIWQYVPGQGLQIHPLANFGTLNALWRSRTKASRTKLAQLLDELLAVAVPRGTGLAWEYYYTFDGGKPPWVSSLAQGTGLQSMARAATKLGRGPELMPTLARGLGMFTEAPPQGVLDATPAGAHYLQYSFAPNLRILNGFIQSLVGLFDFAQLSGDPLAAQLFTAGEAEARIETPTFDTGAWSYYSRGSSTRESSRSYHELLAEFLVSLCQRTGQGAYCSAASHFTLYETLPPVVTPRTTRVRGGATRKVAFSLTKISRVTAVVLRGTKPVASFTLGTIGRGRKSFAWKVPKRPGAYSVVFDATDLAGNAGTATGALEVLPAKKKGRK